MSLDTQALDGFCDMLGQFLTACITVWPEDSALKEYKMGYDMMMNPALGALAQSGKEKLIKEYHDSLSPYFQRCVDKDPTLFTEESIPILEEVHLREKWLSNISEQTRETIWVYILELNRLCQMHCSLFSKIPGTALEKIQSISQDLAAKVQSGQLNLQDIDMASLGQDVVAGLSEEELQGLMSGVLSDPSAIANLASSMAPGSGLDASVLAQAVSGGGLPPGMAGQSPAQLVSMLMQNQVSGDKKA